MKTQSSFYRHVEMHSLCIDVPTGDHGIPHTLWMERYLTSRLKFRNVNVAKDYATQFMVKEYLKG